MGVEATLSTGPPGLSCRVCARPAVDGRETQVPGARGAPSASALSHSPQQPQAEAGFQAQRPTVTPSSSLSSSTTHSSLGLASQMSHEIHPKQTAPAWPSPSWEIQGTPELGSGSLHLIAPGWDRAQPALVQLSARIEQGHIEEAEAGTGHVAASARGSEGGLPSVHCPWTGWLQMQGSHWLSPRKPTSLPSMGLKGTPRVHTGHPEGEQSSYEVRQGPLPQPPLRSSNIDPRVIHSVEEQVDSRQRQADHSTANTHLPRDCNETGEAGSVIVCDVKPIETGK